MQKGQNTPEAPKATADVLINAEESEKNGIFKLFLKIQTPQKKLRYLHCQHPILLIFRAYITHPNILFFECK